MTDWKWIDGYEDLYKIYPNGNVERYYKNGNTKILKHHIGTHGYKDIQLYKNRKKKNLKIHRLLALHFLDNPNDYLFVDHIDRNPLNNNLNNLRWVSRSINNRNRKGYGECMKGVSKNANKFRAQINIDGKKTHLGYFDTELEAHNCFMIEHDKIMKEFI